MLLCHPVEAVQFFSLRAFNPMDLSNLVGFADILIINYHNLKKM